MKEQLLMPVNIGNSEPGFENPIGLMVACHRRIERFLAVLVDLAMRIRGVTLSGTESDALETALRYFRDAAPHHTADEERGLFPTLERSGDQAVSCLTDLKHDHRRAERLHATADRLGLKWLRDGTLGDTDVAELQAVLSELSALYREHIRIEEEHVFPSARRALPRHVLEKLGRDMASRRGVRYIPAVVGSIAAAQVEAP
jgi:hemerythrin-like domain-containing protein